MFRLYGRPDRSVKWKFCYYMTRLDFSIIVHGWQKWPFPKAPPSRESSLFLFTLEAQKKRPNAGYVASGRRSLHYAHLGANCFFPIWHYTQSCFETIIDLQFIENIGQMSLDGLSANKNLFADLVIRQTFGNKG